jgi:uncharacterized coiled-coil protein SlyX
MNPGEHKENYRTKAQLQARIRELETELIQAVAIIEDLSDHGCAAERMALLKAQQAEIDRLTLEHGKMCDSRQEWMEKAIAARQDLDRCCQLMKQNLNT